MTVQWKSHKTRLVIFFPRSLPPKKTSYPEGQDHGKTLPGLEAVKAVENLALSTFPYLRLCAMVELNSTTSCWQRGTEHRQQWSKMTQNGANL